MWGTIAAFVLKFRLVLLLLLTASFIYTAFQTSKVELSYEYTRAIPTDNAKYQAYQNFLKKFGDDGNLLVIGVQTDRLFSKDVFNDYFLLTRKMKSVKGVEQVLSIPDAIVLHKNILTEKLAASQIFPEPYISQSDLDTARKVFENLLFYRGILYNPDTHVYLMAISVNKQIMNSAGRTAVVSNIVKLGNEFGKAHNLQMHFSGLPLIRTNMATKVATEMKWFLLGSVLLSALILLFFFRSLSNMLLSLAVVIIGVVFSLATMHLFGYKITLLNALIPPLIVVIGIPNCIYFLNKYHTSFSEHGEKRKALYEMISKMGIVTLFCNIAAAIGFGVFALTKSAILKEFGVVAGINIMLLFIISIILIPAVLSFLPDPKVRHMKYLTNHWLTSLLDLLEDWALHHKKTIFITTLFILAISVAGMTRLRSESFILDDLPKTDPVYADLKFFESNFKGVMPLEILIDTKRKNGIRANLLGNFTKIDQLSSYIDSSAVMARPISIVEMLKFVRQAYYNNDSLNYGLPNDFDISFIAPYLSLKPDSGAKPGGVMKLANSFIDSSKQVLRISVNMADIGSIQLPKILAGVQQRADELFDTAHYHIEFTGTTVTFLEGSTFIISGLKQSIVWAFFLIAACMLYLFRSVRILVCSLLPNLIPLVITAGVMGWVGVPLKPSTVLVFSIALGIAIDITIRFLVNFKQDGSLTISTTSTVIKTIHSTGISIVYTSLVLIAGFIIFCFSGFGGTQALGWLTSLTLVMATLTNLIFLPALLIIISPKKNNVKMKWPI
ncbi:MAG TPA: MMPL family transporter [Puia sp.]|jgi:predicted RND superfamily exporter protein|nr:MMPL family transporter [Puia sp.]